MREHRDICRSPLPGATLVGLLDDDLPPIPGWRARRHLRRCPACRAELEAMAALRAQLSGTAAALPPAPEFRERVAAALRREAAPGPCATGPRAPRRRGTSRRLALGTACVAALGLVLSLLMPGTPTQSFAQVEQALARVETAAWRSTVYQAPSLMADGSLEVSKKPSVRSYWIRMSPPALVRMRTGRALRLRRVSLPEESYQIIQQPWGRAYSRFEWGIPAPAILEQAERKTPQERLQAAILFSREGTGDAAQWKTREGTGVERSSWKSSKTRLDGKPALRFEAALQYTQQVMPPDTDGNSWKQSGETWTFWVEPVTYRIIRREVRTRFEGFGKSHEMTEISDQFRYDGPPPPGVFGYVPPVGTHYSFVPLPGRPATDAEQAQIEKVVRRALEAWNRGNAAAYAALWDFDYEVGSDGQKRAFRERQIRYLRSGSPFRRWRVLNMSRARTRISSNFVRRSLSDPFPPKQSREFALSVAVEGEEARGEMRRDCLNLNLRRGGDGFRLIRNYLEWIIGRAR
jgi:hypothetical protein